MTQQPFTITGDQINFQIDLAPWLELIQGRVLQRVGDQVDGEDLATDFVGGQTGAVDRD